MKTTNNYILILHKLLKIVVFGICWVLVFQSLVTAIPPKEATNIAFAKGKAFLNLKDADIKTVLQIFAKATGKNIVASDDVTGKVTVTFSGIDPQEGLMAVLRTRGLDWFEEAGTIFVSTKKIMRTYYLANAKPSDLQATLASILPAGSVVTADDSYNALVVQTTSDYLPRLEKLIQELDVPPTQVMVEVKMIQVNTGDEGTLGMNLNYQRNSGNYAKTTGFVSSIEVQGLYARALSIFSNASLEAFLEALATEKKYDIIATPRLTTLNNKEATLLIGSRLGYITTIITQTSTTQQMNFLDVGTTLSITPIVTRNGMIRMKVKPKISEGSIVGGLPQEDTTETYNEVLVKDGQTFVIGGLVKNKDVSTEYGIPILMNLPLIGSLFRRTETSQLKTELVVFVTPHIITDEYLSKITPSYQGIVEQAEKREARLIH
ncbi:MAG: type II secretion system protein GspD [Candidatus Margulisiibacteriota bacterium]